MKDARNRLAVRAGLYTLGQQLTLLFALLLSLSIGAYAIYIGLEQAEFVESMERHHARELTQTLASVLEPHILHRPALQMIAVNLVNRTAKSDCQV